MAIVEWMLAVKLLGVIFGLDGPQQGVPDNAIYNFNQSINKRSLQLYPAIITGDIQLLEQQLALGADSNERDADGNTPLHILSAYLTHHERNSEIASGAACNVSSMAALLLSYGADLAAPNNYGATPLHLAASNQKTISLLRFFLGQEKAKTLVNAQDVAGNIPLHYAREHCNDEAVSLLEKYCTDHRIINKDRFSVPPYHALEQYEDK